VIEPGAQALAEYLRQEDLSGAVLVGHSLGAQIALQAATLAPDHVSRVVVVDSLPFFPGLMNPAADPAMVQARGDAFAAQMAALDQESFMAQVRQGAPIQATSLEHQAQVVSYVAASDQATVVRGIYDALSRDWRPALEAVEVPVTVLVPHNAFIGVSADALAARYGAQYQAIEAVDVRVVADSRHFIMLDQPERFAEELARVLGAPS
jgi:pimeloyl-ACP methyl ester carboxylesterase